MTCPRCGSPTDEFQCPQCGYTLARPTEPADAAAADSTLTTPVPLTQVSQPESAPRTLLEDLEAEIKAEETAARTPSVAVTKSAPQRPRRKRHPIRNLFLLALVGGGIWYHYTNWDQFEFTSTNPYPTVTAPSGSQECSNHGTGPYDKVATFNEITQCGLADNVWQAYTQAGLNGADRKSRRCGHRPTRAGPTG